MIYVFITECQNAYKQCQLWITALIVLIFQSNINKAAVFVHIHSNIHIHVVTNPISTYKEANTLNSFFYGSLKSITGI